MNETVNSPAKWLRYLLYVSIAALVNVVLANIPFISGLSSWVSLAIDVATAYLLFRLKDSNARYQTAAILLAIPLVAGLLNLLGLTILTLVGSICGLVAEYQEYKAHSELIEEKDPKLAGQWGGLFWMGFVVAIITTLVGTVLSVFLAAYGMEMDGITVMITVAVTAVGLFLKWLYLSYLNRTIKLVENEFVV